MGNNSFGNNIDNIFRERLSNHEVKPNSYNWSVIESKLYRSFRGRNSTIFFYSKFAAILLAAICLSILGTKQYITDNNININDAAFLSYVGNAIEKPAPIYITKEVEVPLYNEITKIKYVNNNDFYEMPPEYQYNPTNGETLLSYNDIERIEKSYGDEQTGSEKMAYDYATDEVIASVGKIENNINNAEIENTIPYLIQPGYLLNDGLSLALDGGEATSDASKIVQDGARRILEQKLVKRTGLHLGFGASTFSSWILNNRSTEIDNNSISYPLTFGHQYGGNIGFDFGTKFGFEIGVYKANQGQTIAQIIDLKETKSEIRMDYLHLQLLFKNKWEQYSNLTRNPVILNYVYGIQYSSFNGYQSTVDHSLISPSSIERNHDLGFIMGLEYDIFFNKNYYLTLGARSTYTYGIDNFSEIISEASNSSKTNNFTVGLNASFNYLISN